MRLLKKDTPFEWDERAQESFDALKQALASAPVITPPDYSRDFLLYVAAYLETIGMVLVQEDEELQEHVIYYLSRNLQATRCVLGGKSQVKVVTLFLTPPFLRIINP